ncbi:MAG TPA: DUF4845 domain-containing protein [Burkholderiales bacterium]|nr:DUF4845 domain-containing protein [Burkholderiales bacterium]
MRKRQFGITLSGLLMAAVILITLAMLGMKLAPSYIEFFAIKKAVTALGAEARGGTSVTDIRKGFDNRAMIDAVDSVKGSDLEITKDGGQVVVSVAYRKEIPLVANVGVYIEFNASSKTAE